MRDVSAKTDTLRTARASAEITASPSTLQLIRDGRAPKGDPIPVARVAAIQAAKNTPQIIPYCHSVPLDFVGVEFEMGEASITVTTEVKAVYKTGVEMEALTAAAAAVLNLYDMLKLVDDTMEILSVRLLDKKGGKSDLDRTSTFTARVVVVSDSTAAGRRQDKSGAILKQGMEAHGGTVEGPVVVPDEPDAIRQAVLAGCDAGLDFVVTTGGTGLGPRDVTPDSVAPLFEQDLAGIEDQLYDYGGRRTPYAMLSRLRAGRRGNTVILCVPGSSGGARDAVNSLFPQIKHVLHVLRGGSHGD